MRKLANKFGVVIIGQSQTGKTALLRRETENKYVETYQETIGYNFLSKSYKGDKTDEKIAQYWDTSGAERFGSLINAHYKNAKAVIICVDSTKAIDTKYLDGKIAELIKIQPAPLITLVSTKTDSPIKKTTAADLRAYAAKYENIDVAETSAKHGDGVNNLFQGIIAKLTPVAMTSSIVKEASLLENINKYRAETAAEKAFKRALNELYRKLNQEPLKGTDAANQTIQATNQLLITLETSKNISNNEIKNTFQTYLNSCPHTTNQSSLLGKLIKTVAITGICALAGVGLAAGICLSLGLGIGVGAAIAASAGAAGLFIGSATFFKKNATEKTIQKVADTGKDVYYHLSEASDSKDDLAGENSPITKP